MALDQLLKGYLYNVVFYGGKAVGKSSSMPDWGVTFSTQQVADVLVYLTTTFRGGGDAAATTAVCPQPRSTADAPPEARAVENPLEPSAARLEAGETLYRQTALPMACQLCHGEQGDGLGALAGGFTPRPRNFSCGETMRGIPDGQLFWIIRNGSPGTGMPGYQTLRDEQVWQLVLFVRSFAR
jgi:mono/diheme cytochrome c family protein